MFNGSPSSMDRLSNKTGTLSIEKKGPPNGDPPVLGVGVLGNSRSPSSHKSVCPHCIESRFHVAYLRACVRFVAEDIANEEGVYLRIVQLSPPCDGRRERRNGRRPSPHHERPCSTSCRRCDANTGRPNGSHRLLLLLPMVAALRFSVQRTHGPRWFSTSFGRKGPQAVVRERHTLVGDTRISPLRIPELQDSVTMSAIQCFQTAGS